MTMGIKSFTETEILKRAIADGDTSKILQLLPSNNVDLTFSNKHGDTLLHLVLENDKFLPNEIIEILNTFIARGFDPNIENNAQETVLHLAIAKQLKDVVDFLLKRGAEIDVIDCRGNSTAHFFVNYEAEQFLKVAKISDPAYRKQRAAAENDSASFVKWLLSKGIDFDRKNKSGESALFWAVDQNLQHILPILLTSTRDIHFVYEREHRTLLQSFIIASNEAKNTNYQFCCQSPMYVKPMHQNLRVHSNSFSKRYDIEIVKALLKKGVSVDHMDRWGQTALQVAVDAMEKMDIIELLFERFTKVKDRCGVNLMCAMIKSAAASPENLKFLHALIANGADVNGTDDNWMTPVYHTVKHKNLKAVELLKDNGADFHVITKDGSNLFHVLAEANDNDNPSDCEAIFDLLISKGCHIEGKNESGLTPLHVAVSNKNVVLARNLIAHGADVNCQDYEQELCPLHVAASRGLIELVELLLANGAKVNSKSRRNVRPIHISANFSVTNVLGVLLKHKAEVNARGYRGVSALAKALSANTSENVRELLAHGADISDISVIRGLADFGRNKARKILLQHWVKLKTANLPCPVEYKTYVNEQKYEQLLQDCTREVQILKSIPVDSRTSLYGWLHMDPNQRYMHNEKLSSIVRSPTFNEQFPQYSTVILGNYYETVRRKSLFEPAKEAWLKLTDIHLPDICLQRIFADLNTGDLFEISEILHEPMQNYVVSLSTVKQCTSIS